MEKLDRTFWMWLETRVAEVLVSIQVIDSHWKFKDHKRELVILRGVLKELLDDVDKELG